MCVVLTSCGPDSYINIPSNLSWANIDANQDGVLENYVTSIKFQPCEDCYIYAAAGLLEIQYKIEHIFEPDLNLSEQNIHNCMNIDCQKTGDPRNILEYIRIYGILQEHDSPTGSWASCENCDESFVWRKYFLFKKFRNIYYDEKNKKQRQKLLLVNALQKGPVIIVVNDWLGLKVDESIHYCSRQGGSASHMLVVVGYENFGDILIAKNSHGGKDLIKIKFDGECGVASEAYTVSGVYFVWELGNKFCHFKN